jgi:RHS repeat-associated protein
LTDHQGSIVSLIDAGGGAIRDTSYHAYGTIRATRGAAGEAYGYVGNERDDAVDLGNFGARPFRYDTGAFLAVDPMALRMRTDSSRDDASLPAYAYARSSPVSLVDKDGLDPKQFVPDGSYQLVVRRYAPFKKFAGFEGDRRGPSTSREATYRTGLFVVFDPTTGSISNDQANSSGSQGVNWFTRGLLRSNFRSYPVVAHRVRAQRQYADGEFAFYAEFEANNRGFPGSPNLDTQVAFAAWKKDGVLHVSGELTGDGFPSGEVFLRGSRGTEVFLFEYSTGSGSFVGPMTRLFGNGDDEVLEPFTQAVFLDDDGNFTGWVTGESKQEWK